MNTLRYFLALFLVVGLPFLFIYWLLVHPFVNFWRGRGIGITYGSLLTIITAGMVGLFSLRHFLLSVEYGTILSVKKNVIEIDSIDAIPDTPVLDLKTLAERLSGILARNEIGGVDRRSSVHDRLPIAPRRCLI